MNQTIDRLKLIFLGLFAFITAVMLVVHFVWIAPGKECVAGGEWWDWRQRTCARPILISDITGRVIADPKARAAAKAAIAAARAQPKPPARP